MDKYRKAVLAVFGAVVVTVHELIAQGPWSIVKTLLVVLAVFGAFTVYVAPNLPEGNGAGSFAKAFVALAVAGVETTIPLLDDRAISGSEWLVIAMAVLTAAGVPLVRNAPKLAGRGPDGSYDVSSMPRTI